MFALASDRYFGLTRVSQIHNHGGQVSHSLLVLGTPLVVGIFEAAIEKLYLACGAVI